jgi:hypothetical protein
VWLSTQRPPLAGSRMSGRLALSGRRNVARQTTWARACRAAIYQHMFIIIQTCSNLARRALIAFACLCSLGSAARRRLQSAFSALVISARGALESSVTV